MYAEHFPENGPETKITEAWLVFDEDGNLSSLVSETRSEDGELLASAEMDGVDVVYRDADGVETNRFAGTLENATLSSYRERLLSSYDLMQDKVDEHPDAPLVTLDGTEFLLIEGRSPYSGRPTGPAAWLRRHAFSGIRPGTAVVRDRGFEMQLPLGRMLSASFACGFKLPGATNRFPFGMHSDPIVARTATCPLPNEWPNTSRITIRSVWITLLRRRTLPIRL